MICPKPPVGYPQQSLPDCSAGVDPGKNGGDLLWTRYFQFNCDGGPIQWPPNFVLGPTGDIGVGAACWGLANNLTANLRFNGFGTWWSGLMVTAPGTGFESATTPVLDRNNNFGSFLYTYKYSQERDQLVIADRTGSTIVQWTYASSSGKFDNKWDADKLGNVFLAVKTDLWPATLDANLTLPPSGTYLVRGGGANESYLPNFTGSYLADQVGGVLRMGALPNTLDLGCGPLVPASPASSYIARLDAGWSCVYSHALPVPVKVLADGSGGAILTATSSTALDLGCGALPAAPGWSTFVTRLDAAGNCVWGRSLPLPNLDVQVDATGRVVVSGPAGASPVDLGGGPLAPVGDQDIVLAEYDAPGNHLWSKRLGGPGVTLSYGVVKLSEPGDVYLLVGASGAIDFGGGPISGAPLMASFSPQGVHRWSRGFAISGAYQYGIDGCGALVLMSTDSSFDPGCGKVFPDPDPNFPPPATGVALARFAP